MAVLPFYNHLETIQKPSRVLYNPYPKTLGQHLRKKRIELGLEQKAVAKVLFVTECSVWQWEQERNKPQIQHYPAIIAFLEYYPFEHETETLAGKLLQIRYCSGYSVKRCADYLNVSIEAIDRWERGKPIRNERLQNVIYTLWEELHVQHLSAEKYQKTLVI